MNHSRKTEFFGKVLPERVVSGKVNVRWTFTASSRRVTPPSGECPVDIHSEQQEGDAPFRGLREAVGVKTDS